MKLYSHSPLYNLCKQVNVDSNKVLHHLFLTDDALFFFFRGPTGEQFFTRISGHMPMFEDDSGEIYTFFNIFPERRSYCDQNSVVRLAQVKTLPSGKVVHLPLEMEYFNFIQQLNHGTGTYSFQVRGKVLMFDGIPIPLRLNELTVLKGANQ